MKLHSKNRIKVIGVMSGTSLDGLDIAAIDFQFKNNKWEFQLIAATTIPYSTNWLKTLKNAPTLSGEKLMELHSEYGNFTGKQINEFIQKTNLKPELIASHGHTIFHQPEKNFTLQIGNGAEIAAVTKTKTVADFRVADIALGGQGAPLVPAGDKQLFSDFEYCLNLGGFANISFDKNNSRVAFDICPVNIVLNYFAEKRGLPFDKNGELGKQGKLNSELLQELNNLEFYSKNPPKSLGREWVENILLPVLVNFKTSDLDKIRTIYEHIAIQISRVGKTGKILITGGGAYNSFLIERIKGLSQLEIIIPSKEIIDFKEALIFAFLGVLKIENIINCYASVTGAINDSSCGVIFSV